MKRSFKHVGFIVLSFGLSAVVIWGLKTRIQVDGVKFPEGAFVLPSSIELGVIEDRTIEDTSH